MPEDPPAPEPGSGTPPSSTPVVAAQVVPRSIETEMRASYIDYAMSVIVGRALPDVRDGLKPVHRRILYAMNDMGLTADKPMRKSARIVGEVLGKYHPHGDMAVYDTMVRMAQDFSLRYMLVEGQGNFGSLDGDNPAAMRYTEARLSKIAGTVLADLDEETVDFADNFDATLKEPLVLPALLPNLLVNGSSGIAVGMATNMPPHQLGEVVDAVVLSIDNPQCTVDELMKKLPGPDFPTGGIIQGHRGIVEAYSLGRGIIRVRARTDVEEVGGRFRIVVTEIPYMVNKSNLLKEIAELVKDKVLTDISDLRDESNREGVRVLIELKRDGIPEVVLNQLYKHTALETSFGILNLALVENQPKVLPLRDILRHYVEHRKVVVTRRTTFRLKKAKEREHLVVGLIDAVANIERVIQVIRESRDVEEAKGRLMRRDGFALRPEPSVTVGLSEAQAKAVLDMRLAKLTSLEIQGLRDELGELRRTISELEAILASEPRVLEIIKTELLALKAKFNDKRRTTIVQESGEIVIEDLIPDETVAVLVTNTGYVKRVPVREYRSQNRGGKGLIGMETKEEDHVTDVFICGTHEYVMFFTNKGKGYWLKAFYVPEGDRYSKGKPIVNMLQGLEAGEKVQASIPVKEFSAEKFLLFATRNGIAKKTPLDAYANVRVSGIKAIKLDLGDALVGVAVTDGRSDVIHTRPAGRATRFHEDELRAMGRDATGNIGIRMDEGDEVVGLAVVRPDDTAHLLSITEFGFGKRTPIGEYPLKHRGAHGVINLKVTEKNGRVVSVLRVEENDEILVTTASGQTIRCPANTIRDTGRNAQGVVVMRLEEGDRVIAVARLSPEDAAHGAPETGMPPPGAVPRPGEPPAPSPAPEHAVE
ncbi:MAG: DNA gyrase subunit A [Methanobacteriota archaeon]